MYAKQVRLAVSGLAPLIPAVAFLISAAPAMAQWRNDWGYEVYPAYPSNYPVPPAAIPRPYPGRPYAYGAPEAYGGGDLEMGVDFNQRTAAVVPNSTGEPPGTIVINTNERQLYLVGAGGTAIRYGIGVGRDGFTWKGVAQVGRKSEWPRWIPPKDMLKRRPDLPEEMDGGLENPLGARALYLFQGKRDTLFRIHGTNEPDTIGKAVSSGCIRMMNADVIDLYVRVGIGTRVVVL
jgi:lipoprotein-anchoring transpeptidase ErfK/SrfK